VAGIIFGYAWVFAEHTLCLLQSEVVGHGYFEATVDVFARDDQAKVIFRLEGNLVWY